MMTKKSENILAKLCWSLNGTTGIPFEELFEEANFIYFKAFCDFNPERGNISTYTYSYVQNELISYCQKRGRRNSAIKMVENILVHDYCEEPARPWFEVEPMFIGRSREILEIIFSNEDRLHGTGKAMRGQVVELLREAGWSWSQVWDGMREMKQVVNSLN